MQKNTVIEAAQTHRFDAEYFQKAYLRDAKLVYLNGDRFTTFKNLSVDVDASAFYPSIEEYYGQGDIPFLRVGDVNGFIDSSRSEKISHELCALYPTLRCVDSGDILFTKGGAIDRIGLVTQAAAVSRDLIFLKTSRLGQEWSGFLFAYFMSDFFRRALLRSSSQTTQPHLTVTLVRELPILASTTTLRRRVGKLIAEALTSKDEVDHKLDEAEALLTEALGLGDWSPPEPLSYFASSKKVRGASRLDSQYFMPAKTLVIEALARLPGSALGHTFNSVRELVDPIKDSMLGLVRNFDVTHALEPVLDDEHELIDFAGLGSIKKRMHHGDVAISRLRAYLKEIAVVQCSDDYPTVGSSEFIVLRPKKQDCRIAPATLMTFLRSQPAQTILKWCQDGSQHPRFSEADLLAIPLPDAVAVASPTIERLVNDALSAREKARALVGAARRAVEIAIEQDEAAALRLLDEPEH